MSGRGVAFLLAAWAVLTGAACVLVRRTFALDVDEAHPRAVIASVWSAGQLVGRAILRSEEEHDPALDAARASHPGGTLVFERVVAEGPVVRAPPLAVAFSFVPGKDGASASYGGRTAYVTPDDLLGRQAYDHGVDFGGLQLTAGLDMPIVLAMLSDRLGGVPVRDVLEHGELRRIRVVRRVPGAPAPVRPDAATLTDDDLRAAALEAGRYLARGVDADGRFRYLVDAPTNRTLNGYDWPRHAGATYYLAQVGRLLGDPDVRFAALRAAGYIRDRALLPCGPHRCVGEGDRVDLGSTALTVIAFVEVVRADLDPGYRLVLPALAAFLRAQQRPDGEFMHEFDRASGKPVDVQLLFYSGEAALALSRVHHLLGDSRDEDAASRAVAHLAGHAWSFFGSRYYWGEEHWTCQAMDDLWDEAPNRAALDFCLAWQAFSRKLQYRAGDAPFDCDGAYGFGPLVTPRLTPAGSRTEAVVATLEAAERAAVPAAERRLLEEQARRAMALLVRQQFRPGLTYLFADPAAVEGAIPGTEVDWQLRIDYAQHAGSGMLRWLELHRAVPAPR
ncbi:MAG: hypothetical protein JOZ69_14465 [Myxococcales bacterium]|nr:hypothetical protein [Myxococcales bacterium]